MNTYYSPGKISSPIVPATILHREALVTRLHEAITGTSSTKQEEVPPCKLVLICAPAGYGKTTLLADFAQASTIPCCWCFLDRSDAEPVTFLRLLLASIRQRFPQFGCTFDAFLNNAMSATVPSGGMYPFSDLITALVQAIANEIPERFALLLCNYHEINEHDTINEMMGNLLDQLPAQCTIILESRAIPSFSTALLLSQREVFGISSAALRFSAQELQQLVKHRSLPALNMAEAEQLTHLFDGWIMGILLGTRLGNLQFLNSDAADLPILSSAIQVTQESSSLRLTIREDRLQLFYSLIDKVFHRETERYSFLKEAAILEEMTPTFCNALLSIENADEHLHTLEQQNLFVRRSGTLLLTTYTCHPFLREIFCRDLANQTPERFFWLHRRAAELFRTAQDYSRAIWHALEAQQQELAVEIILAVQKELLAQGQGATLARWIDMFPAPTRCKYLQLQLLRARIHLLFGELDQALPLLASVSELAVSCAQEAVDTDRDILHAEIALTQGRAFFQAGQYAQVQVLCRQVIESIPVDKAELHAEAYLLLGVCANVQGNVSCGIEYLQKALRFWGRDKVIRQTAELHSTLASSYSLLGNFALADHHISRALVCWEQLQDDWGRAYNFVRMGMIKQRQGNLNEAEILFKKALNITHSFIHFERGEAYALVSLGELYLEQGRYTEALTHTENGLFLARKVKDRYLVHYTLCILAMIYMFLKDTQTALLLISEAEPQGNECASYERILYQLTMGAIFLQKSNYKQAYEYLNLARIATIDGGLIREHIQAGIRIAASQLRLGKRADMRQSLTDLIPLLAHGSYKRLLLTEIQYFPDVEQLVMHSPEYVQLRAHLEDDTFTLAQPVQSTIKTREFLTNKTMPNAEHANLKIFAFGEPQVLLNDVPITRWRMTRAMELCFFLLDSGRPLRKEQIITALWKEMDKHVDQTFRSTIYYLKKTLGEHFLQVKSGTYALDITQIWSDVAAFREHQTRYRSALAQNNLFVAREELLKMVELYKGDYVQSFYSDWCNLRRDELRQALLEARHELANICWHLECFEECIIHCQQILAIDNCLEDAHYRIICCYLKQGKRSLAVRQYQYCRTVMHDELGVAPGPTIESLYQQLTISKS